jgi:hypothetical protein
LTTPSFPEDIDFDIVREDWTRFQLKTDKVLLRVRIAVAKIIKTGAGEVGVPDFVLASQNVLSVVAPKELWKPVGQAPELTQPISPSHIKEGTEIDFDPIGELRWQEYKTREGWLIMVRPEVGRVVRLKHYSRMGQSGFMEPIYWANIQSVFRVKKA